MSQDKKIDYSYTYKIDEGKKTVKDSYVVDRKTHQHILVSKDVKDNLPKK